MYSLLNHCVISFIIWSLYSASAEGPEDSSTALTTTESDVSQEAPDSTLGDNLTVKVEEQTENVIERKQPVIESMGDVIIDVANKTSHPQITIKPRGTGDSALPSTTEFNGSQEAPDSTLGDNLTIKVEEQTENVIERKQPVIESTGDVIIDVANKTSHPPMAHQSRGTGDSALPTIKAPDASQGTLISVPTATGGISTFATNDEEYYYDKFLLDARGIDHSTMQQVMSQNIASEEVFVDIYLNSELVTSEWVHVTAGHACLRPDSKVIAYIDDTTFTLSDDACIVFISGAHGTTYTASAQRIDIAANVSQDFIDLGVNAKFDDLVSGSTLFGESHIRGVKFSDNQAAHTRLLRGGVSAYTSGPNTVKSYPKTTLIHETLVVESGFEIDNFNRTKPVDDLSVKAEEQTVDVIEQQDPIIVPIADTITDVANTTSHPEMTYQPRGTSDSALSSITEFDGSQEAPDSTPFDDLTVKAEEQTENVIEHQDPIIVPIGDTITDVANTTSHPHVAHQPRETSNSALSTVKELDTSPVSLEPSPTVSGGIATFATDDEEYYYDEFLLGARGVDHSTLQQVLSQNIANEKVFVDIYLNSQLVESDWVHVTAGQACVRPDSKVISYIDDTTFTLSDDGCIVFISGAHGTTYTASAQRIDIAAKENTQHTITQQYHHGVPALRLNYSWFYRDILDGTRPSQSGNFWLSGHYDGWVSRSNISYSDDKFNYNNTYVTKDFVDFGASARFGDLGSGGTLLGGNQIRGIEFSNNRAELTRRLLGSVSAYTSGPATVKIYQKNTLIHETFVVGGGFQLDNINLLNQIDDLTVKIEEQTGNVIEQQHPVIVSMGDAIIDVPNNAFYSFAAGLTKANNNFIIRGEYTNPTPSHPWLDTYSAEFAGYSNGNVGMGTNGQFSISDTLQLNGEGTISYVRGNDQFYASWRAGLNYRNNNGLNASYHINHYNRGRVSLDEDQPEQGDNLLRQSHSLSLSYANSDLFWGNARLNFIKRIYQQEHRNFTTFTYNMPVFNGNLSVNYSSSLDTHDNELSVSLSIPLGGKRYRGNSYTQYRKAKDRARLSTRATAHFDNVSTSANIDYNDYNHAVNKSVSLQAQSPLTTWSASYSHGETSDSFHGSVQGGVALYDGGYALSPRQISDTFAIVKVKEQGSNKQASGVSLSRSTTPPAWKGDLIDPSLMPYGANRVAIDVNRLPNHYNSLTDSFTIKPIKGAVIVKEIPIERVTRAIVTLDNPSDSANLVIENTKGEYLGTVDRLGQFILYDRSGLSEVYSLWNGKHKVCDLAINWHEIDTNQDAYLYKVSAKCN